MSTELERAAERAVAEASEEADQTIELDIDPDRTKETQLVFSRMRTEWRPGDAGEVRSVLELADGIVHRAFPDIYLLMNELWHLTRQPVTDPVTGEITTDLYGWPLWARYPSGAVIEDYSRLTNREKDDFLLRVTTGLIEWEQRAAALWTEAMLAKARWEEAMADGFLAPTGRWTVEERTQRGRVHAREDRYHAIFRAAVSRSADQLVRSTALLGQRLKDSLTA